MAQPRLLGGRYELRRRIASGRIASGRIAEVYLAADHSRDREVVVAVLHQNGVANRRARAHVLREAQAAGSAHHPGALAVYDWGEDGRTGYVVMEYLPDTTGAMYATPFLAGAPGGAAPGAPRHAEGDGAFEGMPPLAYAGYVAGRLSHSPALVFVLALALLSLPIGVVAVRQLQPAKVSVGAAEVAGARAVPTPGKSAPAPAPPPQAGSTAARPTVAVATSVPAATATPTEVPLAQATGGAASPLDAVLGFYTDVAYHRFDQATALWSPHMQAAYPPDENVVARFTPTQRLYVQNATVTARDDTAGTATVSVRVQEVSGSPAETRTWAGTWQLVRGPRGWLLDRPELSPA